MPDDKPVLIEAVINGVANPEFNPHVPSNSEEIRDDILACFEAGASMVHNHAGNDAKDPSGLDSYLASWAPVLERFPGAILYPTIGSSGSVGERFGHLSVLAERGMLRVGAIDAGSTNLGVRDEEGVPLPSESVYANSYAYIAEAIAFCHQYELATTFAIFEPTFLHTVIAYHRAGRLPRGSWLKFYFGGAGGYAGSAPRERLMAFGLPPTPKALDAYLEIMEGCDMPWGVSACGADVVGCGIARTALERGGHVHVGLEMYEGERQATNRELVEEVVSLCKEVGRPPLPWNETAEFLGFSKSLTQTDS
ncbi:3-keto-5-aminohexanoate cleavage protein [Myxococcota bacterium]|nr:3-keto-5-aminohexanoate cleavage protein [Myxococcota bacterium]